MPEYDVFLCHATPDKSAVEKIGRQLHDAGLKPFLDKSNLIPGRNIQPSLEQAMTHSASCAVFIGPDERGPWQSKEIQLALQRQIREPEFGVIPVFLPGCPSTDELTEASGFLMLNLGVDFRSGLDDSDALHRLISGIRGESPRLAAARRRRSGEPGKLTIELRLENNRLTRHYLGPYGPLAPEQSSDWQTIQQIFQGWFDQGAVFLQQKNLDRKRFGDRVFCLLFGDNPEQCSRRVLGEVFGERKHPPNPNRHPLRIRLHPNDPLLANLPWSCLRWENHSLKDMFWTLELAAPTNDGMNWPTSEVPFGTPCQVLLIAPHQEHFDSVRHVRAIKEKFEELWPGTELPREARDRFGVESAIRARRPQIVYFYGQARVISDTMNLLLENSGPALDPGSFQGLWPSGAEPKILFLNLVEDDLLHPTWAARAFSDYFQLVVVQHSPADRVQQARDSVLRWFDELFTNDDPHVDPVGMLHCHSLETATAWTRYHKLQIRTSDRIRHSALRPLARMLLNRDEQRDKALRATSDLTGDGNLRVICLLSYGGPGNMAEIFGQQIYTFLEQRHTGTSTLLKSLSLYLPPGDLDRGAVDRQLREPLGLDELDSLKQGLAGLRPLVADNPWMVSLLNWQVLHLPEIRTSPLMTWLQYCRTTLVDACPDDMSLLSCLILEAPEERHDRLAALFNALSRDPQFRSPAFRLEVLDPLDRVNETHLADYLASNNCHCPEEIREDMQWLIYQDARGVFERTAELIDDAEMIPGPGWWGLRDRLVARHGEPAQAREVIDYRSFEDP